MSVERREAEATQTEEDEESRWNMARREDMKCVLYVCRRGVLQLGFVWCSEMHAS